MNAPALKRRELLQLGAAGGAALVLGFRLAPARAAAAASASAAFQPNAWLRIEPSGAVTVLISKTEMGQGTATGIAMIVADELDADWARVSVRTIEPDGKRFMITGGSFSIAASWNAGREAAAAARQLLLQAGAEALGVPVDQCRTERHQVIHAASSRQVDYGALVARAAALPPIAKPALKPPADYKLIGRSLPAKNLQTIVRGEAIYGTDVVVPGMLYATIERSPVINGRLAKVDDRAARAVPGVLNVVKLRGNTFPTTDYIRDGVAVVARSTWTAQQGRRALQIRWHETGADKKARNGAIASSRTLAEDFTLALAPPVPAREGEPPKPAPDGIHAAVSANRRGSPEAMNAALQAAAKTLDLTYDVPLQAHAPMEPMNAVASWTAERCEVWAPCHYQTRLLNALRDLTGLPADRIVIHTPMLGGSFGRRLDVDYAIEAVMLSRELEKPVQVLWTREDDMRCGLYAPPSRHHLRIGLGADGSIQAFDHAFAALSVLKQQSPEQLWPSGIDWAAAIDGVKFPYAAEQFHVSHRLVEQTVRVFWWRRGYTPNHTFVNECALDECAHAAGIDPLRYRLKLLPPPQVLKYTSGEDTELIDTGRLANVLKAAAEAAGWERALPAGQGRGLASTVTDTYVAQIVEVDARQGTPRVTRVITAVDCGRVINPQLVKAQVEGSVVFGLTAALKGAITVEQGRIQQGNFNDYPLLRFDEMPAIETVLIDSSEAPTGIGEPASHTVAAALSNAIFAATTRRLRSLPFALG
jgi:isoquinoline 1-oxidoreductase beta subunit